MTDLSGFNIVDIQNNTSLGYGLDLRVNRSNKSEAVTSQLLFSCDNLTTNKSPVQELAGGEFYVFPTTPQNVAISSTDAGDNQIIRVYYFATSTSETPSFEDVTLNGQTKVNLVNTMYRIQRMIVYLTSTSINAGDVYLYLQTEVPVAGKPPANIYCSMEGSFGVSRQSYIYTPFNWNSFNIFTQVLSSNALLGSLEIRLRGYRRADGNQLLNYKFFDAVISVENQTTQFITSEEINPGATVYFECERVSGVTNARIQFIVSYSMFR